jgi:opacity protein-like surface antigen
MIGLKLTGAAALFLGLAGLAQAADMPAQTYEPVAPVPSLSGFYLGSISSVNFADDTDFTVGGLGISTSYDVGFYTGARLGYSFGPMFSIVSPRLEVEGGYFQSDVDSHSLGGVDIPGSFGDIRGWQGYLNGYLDIGLGLSGITPYVGGGVGFADVELHKQGVSALGIVVDDSDTAFAYHLDAGLSFQLDHLGFNWSLLQGTTLDVGYRYTNVSDLTFTAVDGTEADTDYTSNAVTFGFRKFF